MATAEYAIEVKAEFQGPINRKGLRYKLALGCLRLGESLIKSKVMLTTEQKRIEQAGDLGLGLRRVDPKMIAMEADEDRAVFGSCSGCLDVRELAPDRGRMYCSECREHQAEPYDQVVADMIAEGNPNCPDRESNVEQDLPAPPSRPSRVPSFQDRLRRLLGR